jgi:hypothetical protein
LGFPTCGLWGRNGFDGDKEALAAYRAFLSARKTDGNLNIIADDYAYKTDGNLNIIADDYAYAQAA